MPPCLYLGNATPAMSIVDNGVCVHSSSVFAESCFGSAAMIAKHLALDQPCGHQLPKHLLRIP
jgi:hypothetical protein